MSYNNSDSKKTQDRTFVDHAIRAKTVLVIDGINNENLGVMTLSEAIKKAFDQGLNLVQMSPSNNGKPPTCKILDYGKFKYDESKRIKAVQKKQREAQIEEKEIVFRPDTAIHDLKVKARKTIQFLKEGNKVTVTIKCVGREITHPDVFKSTFNSFMELIPNGVAVPISNEMHQRFSYLVSCRESKKSNHQ